MTKVTILMATYNGEKHLKEQLDSIINQSYSNWELLIRDDGSADNTVEIINYYVNNDNRIKLIKDDLGNLGQCMNFNELMKNSKDSEYVMFADQDDVWLEDKIKLSLNKIKDVESKYNNTPALVYSNYEIVDKKLDHLRFPYSKNILDKNIQSRLLVQNWILGCTMIINNELLKNSIPLSIKADNHDYWIALMAAFSGVIRFLDKKTLLHRIHDNNVTTNSETTKFKNRVLRTKKRFIQNNDYFQKKRELYEDLKSCLNNDDYIILNKYKKILDSNSIISLINAVKYNFYGVNKLQTILFLVQLLFKRKGDN